MDEKEMQRVSFGNGVEIVIPKDASFVFGYMCKDETGTHGYGGIAAHVMTLFILLLQSYLPKLETEPLQISFFKTLFQMLRKNHCLKDGINLLVGWDGEVINDAKK